VKSRGIMGGMTASPAKITAGQALVARIHEEMRSQGLEPDGRELELLALAADLEDQRVSLLAAVKRDGRSKKLDSGRVVLHPGIAEARQTALALAKVLSGVQMEQVQAKDPAKQAAAQARWRSHNLAKSEAAQSVSGS
jgi:hypothetical protein